MVERKTYQRQISADYATPSIGVVRERYTTQVTSLADSLSGFVDKATREQVRLQSLADRQEAITSATNAGIQSNVFGITVEGVDGLGNVENVKAAIPPQLRKPVNEASLAYNRAMLAKFHTEAEINMTSTLSLIAARSGNNLELFEKNAATYWESLKKQSVKAPGLEVFGDYRAKDSPLHSTFIRLHTKARAGIINANTQVKTQELQFDIQERLKSMYANPEQRDSEAYSNLEKEALALGVAPKAIEELKDKIIVEEYTTNIYEEWEGKDLTAQQKSLTNLRKNYVQIARELGVDPAILHKSIVDINASLTSSKNEITIRIKKLRGEIGRNLSSLITSVEKTVAGTATDASLTKLGGIRNDATDLRIRLDKEIEKLDNGEGGDPVELANLTAQQVKVTQLLKNIHKQIGFERKEYTEAMTETLLAASIVIKAETEMTEALREEARNKLKIIQETLKVSKDNPNIDRLLLMQRLSTASTHFLAYLNRFKTPSASDIERLQGKGQWGSGSRDQRLMTTVYERHSEFLPEGVEGGIEDDDLESLSLSGTTNPALNGSAYQPHHIARLTMKYKALPSVLIVHAQEVAKNLNAKEATSQNVEHMSAVIGSMKRAGIVGTKADGTLNYNTLTKLGMPVELLEQIEIYDRLKLSSIVDGQYDPEVALQKFNAYKETTEAEISKGLPEGETIDKAVETTFTKYLDIDAGDDFSQIPPHHRARVRRLIVDGIGATNRYEGGIAHAVGILRNEYGTSEFNRDYGAGKTEKKTFARRPLEQVIDSYLGSDKREEGITAAKNYLKEINPKWELGKTHFLQFDSLSNNYFVIADRVVGSDQVLVGGQTVEVDASSSPIKVNLFQVLSKERSKLTQEKKEELKILLEERSKRITNPNRRGRLPKNLIQARPGEAP